MSAPHRQWDGQGHRQSLSRQAKGQIFSEIPIHKPAYPFLYRHSWGIPRELNELVHVCLGFVDVAGLHGNEPRIGGPSQTPLHDTNQIEKLDGTLIPDIADT